MRLKFAATGNFFPRTTLLISFIATAAFAGSVGSYGGCKSLKSERAACEACLSGGNFDQVGTVRFQMPASSGGESYGFRPVKTVK